MFDDQQSADNQIYDFITDPYGTRRAIPEELSFYAPDEHDYHDFTYNVRVNNIRDGKLVLSPDRSPYAYDIVKRAYSNIGTGLSKIDWLPEELSVESADLIKIGKDELTAGDIMVHKEDGKQNAIVTAAFEDKIEVIVEAGEDYPVRTQFIKREALNDQFAEGFRYNPDISK